MNKRKSDFPYNRFRIGDAVEFIVVTEVSTDDGVREAHVLSKSCRPKNPLRGEIVGIKTFYLGKVRHSSGGCNGEWDYEQGYLLVEGTIVLWAIKQGMMNKEIYVKDEDIYAVVKNRDKFPIRYGRKLNWNEKDRQIQREIMSDIPRDSKGRWLKI